MTIMAWYLIVSGIDPVHEKTGSMLRGLKTMEESHLKHPSKVGLPLRKRGIRHDLDLIKTNCLSAVPRRIESCSNREDGASHFSDP
jgi:hypothetical protein